MKKDPTCQETSQDMKKKTGDTEGKDLKDDVSTNGEDTTDPWPVDIEEAQTQKVNLHEMARLAQEGVLPDISDEWDTSRTKEKKPTWE